MLSTDYTTEETEYYSSSSPSEDSGDPFRQHLNSDPFRHQLNSIPSSELNSIPSSDSDDDSGDESYSPAPSPIIQKIKQQQQMQRSLPPSSFNNGSAFGDEETADGRRKRPRAQGNGVPEPPTKKKMTVKHSEEIPVKGHNKAQKQKVTGDASTSKEEEARKQIGVETAGASKAKKEVQKQSFAEIASGSKEEKKKKQKQTVAENGNTSKETKKVQKQNVVESVSRPFSPQHSSKYSQHWSPADELAFFHGVLSYSKRGNGLPSIMAPVYDYVRPMFSTQYNNSQLYNKFRWGRNKFHSITAKIEANSYTFKKNKYEFDNSHQAALYEVWAKLWGKEDNAGDEHGNHVEQEQAVSASANCKGKKKQHADAEEVNASVGSKGKKKKDVEAEEEDAHKIRGEEDQRQKEEDEEDVPTGKKTLSHALSKLKGGDMTISRKMYNQFCEERDASLKELKSVVQKIFEDTHSEVKTMLEGRLHQQ